MVVIELPLPLQLDEAALDVLEAGLKASGDVVLLTGRCEGLCLDGPSCATLSRVAALTSGLLTDRRPVIAALTGPTLGGGVGLVAAADVVLAHPDASFGLPEVYYGLVPGTVLPVLIRRVGPAVARRMALGAPSLTAAEAQAVGLVDEVDPDPGAGAARWIARLGRAAPHALAEIKGLEDVDAVEVSQRLLATDATRARLARQAAGEVPW